MRNAYRDVTLQGGVETLQATEETLQGNEAGGVEKRQLPIAEIYDTAIRHLLSDKTELMEFARS